MEKIKVEFCTGTSCHLLGAHELKLYLLENEDFKEKIELSAQTCLGNCGNGPNIKINDNLYSKMSVVKLEEILYDILNENEKE